MLDAAEGALVIAVADLGLAAVQLLLSRLDHRKDEIGQRPDVAEALVDLHQVLRSWAVAARDVNDLYRIWVANGRSGTTFDDYDSWESQRTYIKVFDDLLGVGNDYAQDRPRPALRALEIYAPEVRENLTALANNRLDTRKAVDDLLANYSANIVEVSEEQLEQSAAGLENAAEQLRLFIVQTFPAHRP